MWTTTFVNKLIISDLQSSLSDKRKLVPFNLNYNTRFRHKHAFLDGLDFSRPTSKAYIRRFHRFIHSLNCSFVFMSSLSLGSRILKLPQQGQQFTQTNYLLYCVNHVICWIIWIGFNLRLELIPSAQIERLSVKLVFFCVIPKICGRDIVAFYFIGQ
jgi:hypothetical protein